MTEADFDATYPTFTRTLKVGPNGETVTLRTDTAADMVAATQELVEELDDLVKADALVRKALGGSSEKPAARAPSSRPAGRTAGGSKPAGRGGARSVRPGSGAPKRGGAKRNDDVPMSDELCEHDEPYKDLLGMGYKSGPKKGQLYPNRFYATCEQGCEAWGEQED